MLKGLKDEYQVTQELNDFIEIGGKIQITLQILLTSNLYFRGFASHNFDLLKKNFVENYGSNYLELLVKLEVNGFFIRREYNGSNRKIIS